MKHKLLFITKKRSTEYGYLMSSGLLNSARMVIDALKKKYKCECTLVDVIDGNCIEREICKYEPTVVILEAIWCPPYKLNELANKYPDIKFTVRNHSNPTFLAGEGMALTWINEYAYISNYRLSANSVEAVSDFNGIGIKCLYAPNIYSDLLNETPHGFSLTDFIYDLFCKNNKYIKKETLDIACFGAIRPLKNQLLQAMVSIKFANDYKKKLRFHINVGRIEMSGNNFLKNIRAIFADSMHELIEHDWVEHADFLKLIKTIDLGLQCSLSETFNIVFADFVAAGVPCVGSPEIKWSPKYMQANPTCGSDIYEKMEYLLFKKNRRRSIKDCINNLIKHNNNALSAWKKFLKTI